MPQRVTDILEIANLQGVTQSAIAAMLGVNPSSISRSLGGIPAVSPERIRQICSALAVDEEFLFERSDYPFLPSSFVIFRIKGLKARRHSLAWLELLVNNSQHLKVLLLLQRVGEKVEVACIKDNRGSVFFVFIEIPITRKSVFDFATRKHLSDRIVIVAKSFFDSTVLALYRSAIDIGHYDRNAVDELIEEAFLEFLTDKEKKLIKVVRNSNTSIDKIIEYVEKMDR